MISVHWKSCFIAKQHPTIISNYAILHFSCHHCLLFKNKPSDQRLTSIHRSSPSPSSHPPIHGFLPQLTPSITFSLPPQSSAPTDGTTASELWILTRLVPLKSNRVSCHSWYNLTSWFLSFSSSCPVKFPVTEFSVLTMKTQSNHCEGGSTRL